jgi:HK97 family phage major capsid protein
VKKTRSFMLVAALGVLAVAAVAAVAGHPIANYLPHDVLAALGAMGGVAFGSTKTFAEQIASLTATRDAKVAEMKAIGQKSSDEKRSMDTGEAEQFDTLDGEIKRLDADVARLSRLAEIDKQTLAPVVERGAGDPTAPRLPVQIKTVEKLAPGIGMARYAMCLVKAKGNHQLAFQLAQKHFPNTEAVVQTLKAQAEGANLAEMMQIKAAVSAGTSTDSTWAAPLVYANTFMGDFIEFLRPRTLIGQADFRKVPFNVRILGQTSGGTSGWVGQGKAKPVTKFDFNATTVPFTKVAAISVLTQELARFSDPSAEALVRDSLADCVIARVDADLFDPDVAAVANVSPAGLLNGVAPVVVTINPGDADSIRCALLALWAPWDATNIGARPAYYTTPAVARLLASTRDALGTPSFPGVTVNGGTLDGIPLRTSNYLANNGGSGGAPFILVDEAEIFLADDGNVTLDMSDQASLEMNDAPSGSSATPTAAQLVSMWQSNSIAFRAERFIWWGPRRSGAIQWIDGFPVRC